MRKTASVVVALVLVGTLAAGCRRGGDAEAEPEYMLVPVERGDLTVEVTSSGSLAYSSKEQLSFGVAGTVDEVLVEEGDTVAEGQLLASLDGVSVTALDQAVSQARIDLRDAEDSLEAVLNPYTASDVAAAELAITSAEVALQAAVDSLEQMENAYTESDLLDAELAVMDAEAALEAAENAFDRAEDRHQRNTSYDPWETDFIRKGKLLDLAGYDLIAAEDAVAEIQAGADPLLVEEKQEQVTVAAMSLTDAEEALAELLGDSDRLFEELRLVELAIAQATLDDALLDLERYAIVAPFAGIVTTVSIEAYQAVAASTPAVVLTDPTSFEAIMLVNEIDIIDVTVGAAAVVEINALPGISFPATVTTVATTAVGQSGVVNYRVAAEIESLARPLLSEIPKTGEGATLSEAEIAEILNQAIKEGRLPTQAAGIVKQGFAQFGARITAEQLEQMIDRFGQIDQDLTEEQREALRERVAGGLPQRSPHPGAERSLDSLQLREGLSVTVSIIIEQRTNVLIVPNQAITLDGGQSYVNVSRDDVIEPRAVVTGLSDWQNTEITEGLSDGEVVAIPVAGSPRDKSDQDEEAPSRFPGGLRGLGK